MKGGIEFRGVEPNDKQGIPKYRDSSLLRVSRNRHISSRNRVPRQIGNHEIGGNQAEREAEQGQKKMAFGKRHQQCFLKIDINKLRTLPGKDVDEHGQPGPPDPPKNKIGKSYRKAPRSFVARPAKIFKRLLQPLKFRHGSPPDQLSEKE